MNNTIIQEKMQELTKAASLKARIAGQPAEVCSLLDIMGTDYLELMEHTLTSLVKEVREEEARDRNNLFNKFCDELFLNRAMKYKGKIYEITFTEFKSK